MQRAQLMAHLHQLGRRRSRSPLNGGRRSRRLQPRWKTLHPRRQLLLLFMELPQRRDQRLHLVREIRRTHPHSMADLAHRLKL